MTADISEMEVERVMSENPQDLSQYGLDKPEAEVTAVASGKEYKILIGDESPVGLGRYVRRKGDPRVFLVRGNLVSNFIGKNANDLRDKQMLRIPQDKVNRLRITVGEFSLDLEKKDGRWGGGEIPDYVEINQDEVDALTRTFSTLRTEGFVEDEPQDLAKYGLDKPQAEISLFEDGKEVALLFGRKKDENYYAKLASEDSIYSVGQFVFDRIPKSLSDIREKNLVKLAHSEIDKIEIEKGDKKIVLLKKEEGWVLKDDKNLGVDVDKVESLLWEITNLRVEKFVDDAPPNLASYGLDKPQILVSLSAEGKKETLAFGKKAEEVVYCRVYDKKSVYLVGEEILSLIPSSKDELT